MEKRLTRISSLSRGLLEESIYLFKSRSRYSNTRYSLSEVYITSCSSTIDEWRSPFNIEISRIAVEGTPSI